MRIGAHDSHPIADTLPLMPPHRLASHVDDIKTNGQRVPIVLLDGQVLDGRNTYLACIKAKIEPVFREFGSLPTDGDDPFLFVVSMNFSRRDLDDGQRALSTRRLVVLNQQMRLPGVDDDALEMAERVQEDGTAELVAAVDAGEVRLDVAAEIAKREPDEQAKALEAMREVEEPEPERAKAPEVVRSLAVTLSPVELVQLRVACQVLAKSPHPEARGAVEVIRKMAPRVGR
jgi:hypothetical protein